MEIIYEKKMVKYPTKYIAKDGEEFKDELSCKNHERYLDVIKSIENIPHFQYEIEGFIDWFYITSKSDYDNIIDFVSLSGHICKRDYMYHNECGWYGFAMEFQNDYADEIHYTSLNVIKNCYDKFIKMIENIEVKNE